MKVSSGKEIIHSQVRKLQFRKRGKLNTGRHAGIYGSLERDRFSYALEEDVHSLGGV